MKRMNLVVMVTTSEDTVIGIISEFDYEKWLTDDETEYNDICSLFWSSDFVKHFDTWAQLNTYLLDNDMIISEVVGGLQY